MGIAARLVNMAMVRCVSKLLHLFIVLNNQIGPTTMKTTESVTRHAQFGT
jgi:hypothetical protein